MTNMNNVKKINNLTLEQIAKFPEYVKKYTNIGLDTTPIDFEKAKEVVKLCYETCGLTPPEKIVYCKSPFSAILTINVLRQLNSKSVRDSVLGSVYQSVSQSVLRSVRDLVRQSVWLSVWPLVSDSVSQSVSQSVLRSVRDSVSDLVSQSVSQSVLRSVRDSISQSVSQSVLRSVRDSVSDSVYHSVWQSVWQSVWRSVRDSVSQSVRDSVSQSVLRSVRDSVLRSVRDSVSDLVYYSVSDLVKASISDSKLEFISSTLEGQHNVGFVSLYEYFRHECGLKEETEPTTAIFELTKTTGWVYLYQNIAFICDRPCKLYRDNKGRLHSDDCAALEYSDGYKIYAWHGTRVSEYVILNPEKITIKDILQEKNSAIRRVKRLLR